MAKSRTKKAKRGKSLKADIEEEKMPTVSEDNNEDSGDESVEISNKEYTKTPRKIQSTTTPAPPKFIGITYYYKLKQPIALCILVVFSILQP